MLYAVYNIYQQIPTDTNSGQLQIHNLGTWRSNIVMEDLTVKILDLSDKNEGLKPKLGMQNQYDSLLAKACLLPPRAQVS